MRPLAILACLAVVACAHNRASAPRTIPGPISAPPAAHGGISTADAHAIANEANATAAGDRAAVKAARVEEDAVNRAETRANMRLATLAGLLVLAIGLGLAKYGAAGLGSAVAVVGGAIVAGAMTISALVPYEHVIAGTVAVIALGAGLWHLRNSFHGVRAVATNSEHKAGAAVRRVIARARRGMPAVVSHFPTTITFPANMPAQPVNPESK